MGSAQLVGYGELMGEIDPDLVGYDAQIGISNDQIGAARPGKVQANRRYAVGLGAVVVPAGGSAILRGAPTLKFRADRLMLVPTGPGALVTQVMAGNVSQTMGSNGSPVEAFGPVAFGAAMTGQTIDPAVEIFVTLTNPTLADITVSGTVLGLADQ
jgi:hypothetical protein